MTFIYSVILFTGCAGNLITCCIIYGNRHMHTATNYYLFSLAVSDLLLLLTGAPQEIVIFWFKSGYVFGGELFCVLRGVAAETSANATVLMITAFTVERYVAVCHPFLATSMSKLSRVFKIVVILWLVALSFAVPQDLKRVFFFQALQFGIVGEGNFEQCNVKRLLMRYSFEVSSMLFFVIPMTVISVLYLLIWLNLRRTETLQLGQKHSHRGSFSDKGRIYRGKQAPSTSSRKLLKMLVAVVVAFFICWAPFHVQRIVTIHLDLSKSPSSALKVYEAVTYTSGILYYTSTTINPILYNIMSLKFRQAFKVSLRNSVEVIEKV
ncbi:hypothetical protein AAG570_002352 [Ranatra chinensis]|uniref:G-protein coupled receptors family 1 profile domain-containing protein n=1 Tax=Ranatra chinensis TaxID=642074 RepID=A0ABD0Y790_9HEMI